MPGRLIATWFEPTAAGFASVFANDEGRKVGKARLAATDRQRSEQLPMNMPSVEGRSRAPGEFRVSDGATHLGRLDEDAPSASDNVVEGVRHGVGPAQASTR